MKQDNDVDANKSTKSADRRGLLWWRWETRKIINGKVGNCPVSAS